MDCAHMLKITDIFCILFVNLLIILYLCETKVLNIKVKIMRVTVNGKIVAVLEKKSGISKAGNEWCNQDYVIQPDGDEDVIAFNVFGEENIANYNLRVGSVVSVTLAIRSREYNGKYYPEVRAIQCYSQSGANTASVPAPAPAPASEASTSNNLPF